MIQIQVYNKVTRLYMYIYMCVCVCVCVCMCTHMYFVQLLSCVQLFVTL